MGGRGAGSGVRGNTGGDGRIGSLRPLPLAGITKFEDGDKTNTMATIEDWEAKKNGLDHEQLIMVGENGFAVAAFDGDKGSVAFALPIDPRTGRTVDASTLTLTHIHPTEEGRPLGGTFSFADMRNHIRLGFKETRAAAPEGTYSFRTTSESNPRGMLNALNNYDSDVAKAYNTQLASLQKQGYNLTQDDKYTLFLGAAESWVRNNAYKYGYEYEFTPRG